MSRASAIIRRTRSVDQQGGSVVIGSPPYPTHNRSGSSKERQEIGLPGHCERCAEVGHVRAHKNLGCGDVGCSSPHGPGEPDDA
jgi:hypothetical protein